MSEGKLRILLVEDNPADAELLQETLSGLDERLAITHVERWSRPRVPAQGTRSMPSSSTWVCRTARAGHAGATARPLRTCPSWS